jgi:rod shape determining protein RodA
MNPTRLTFKNLDWGLILLILIILAIGLVTLYSATNIDTGSAMGNKLPLPFTKQIIWIVVGLAAMFVTSFINHREIERWSYVFYGILVVLLILVILQGKVTSGSQRWLPIGPFRLQPSEFMKLALILAVAKYFHHSKTPEPYYLRNLLVPAVLIILPCFLIIIEPDLGGAALLFIIAVSIILFMRVARKSIIIFGIIAVTLLPIGWFFILHDYQQGRVLTFFNPDRDPLGTGYQILQSKTAVGSGQFLGKGYLQGTQTQLKFLPEQHTDFIFSVLAEEWGFVGSILLLALYLLVLLWGLSIAAGCRDKFSIVTCIGIVAMIFWQVILNTGMVIGIVPVVGITLPFVSYGGSSMLTSMIGLGILLSVQKSRFASRPSEITV